MARGPLLLSFERVLLLSTASPPRYRGRCWAAIRLSHRPEPSGRVGSMDWTVEDDMVDGLFYATLTGRRGGHTPVVQAGAETSDTGAEGFSRTQALRGRVIPRVCVPVSGIKMQSLVGLSTHSAFHWWSAHRAARTVCCCCQKNWWVAVRRYKWVSSIWGAVHLHPLDGWALSGAGVQTPWDGALR